MIVKKEDRSLVRSQTNFQTVSAYHCNSSVSMMKSPSSGPGSRRKRSRKSNTNAPLATLYDGGSVDISRLMVISWRSAGWRVRARLVAVAPGRGGGPSSSHLCKIILSCRRSNFAMRTVLTSWFDMPNHHLISACSCASDCEYPASTTRVGQRPVPKRSGLGPPVESPSPPSPPGWLPAARRVAVPIDIQLRSLSLPMSCL